MCVLGRPLWLWLVAASPFLIWLALRSYARNPNTSLKPLMKWIFTFQALLVIPFMIVGFDRPGGNKGVRAAVQAAFYTCLCISPWLQRRNMFETLRSPNTKWYSKGNSAEFSISSNTRILVRDIDAVSPWYVEKLGLLRSVEEQPKDSSSAIFRFKADGRPLVLTTRGGTEIFRQPILFTKKIGKVRDVMSARGVNVGAIEQDRQGTHYFQIHDPEGNAIEVAEER